MSEQDPKQSPGANAASLNDAGRAPSEAASARTAEFLERGAEMAKAVAELGAHNMEAFVASAKVAGRAAESLTREVTEYQRKNFEDAFAMARSFAEVRSPADLLRVQSQFAKAAFENAMAFSNNVRGTLTRIAGEAAGPAKPSPSAGS
ncbi:phasin family protein [Sphingomonas mucosissima]|uniref:Phasin protein n=1 Tax=Sphingomonas mucosissima TaxID=370959 RepID=A0A245ZJT5_9SPHN|nr:phasin family protein [Sphingomonas mucosissima]OWK30009.1 phasin protein [Sphingomonas mucosissima]